VNVAQREGRGIPFNWDVHIGDVMQNEIDEPLVPVLSDILDKRLGLEDLAHLVGRKTVLGKCIIKILDN
jgi:hypothetical protein